MKAFLFFSSSSDMSRKRRTEVGVKDVVHKVTQTRKKKVYFVCFMNGMLISSILSLNDQNGNKRTHVECQAESGSQQSPEV